MQMPRPTSSSGVALTSDWVNPETLPNTPTIIDAYALSGLAPSSSSTIAPNSKATSTAATGISKPNGRLRNFCLNVF